MDDDTATSIKTCCRPMFPGYTYNYVRTNPKFREKVVQGQDASRQEDVEGIQVMLRDVEETAGSPSVGHHVPAAWLRPAPTPAMYGGDPLDQLASVATRLTIRRGRQIYGEGDPAAFCYKVLSGSIRAIKSMADGGRQVYEFYLPGDFFGFDSRAAHYFSAEAVSDAIVLKYPRRSVDRLVSESPAFAETVQRLTTRNLQSAYERIVLLTQKSAQERLAWFLLNIAQRAKGDRAQGVDLPMPRSDIADYLGLVIETVSRTFSQLKRAGLISMRSVNRVEFPNKRRLEELCGDL